MPCCVSFALRVVLCLVSLGDAEVEHLHEIWLAAALGQQDVLRLEVAVDDAEIVGLEEGTADLNEQLVHPLRRDRPALKGMCQIFAPDELHDDKERFVLELAEIVELDRIRVVEIDDRLTLAMEASDELRIVGQLRVQRLDRDLTRRGPHLLLGEVDLAHSAFAEELNDAVAPHDDAPDERIAPGARLLLEHGAALVAELRISDVLVLTSRTKACHRFPILPKGETGNSPEAV